MLAKLVVRGRTGILRVREPRRAHARARVTRARKPGDRGGIRVVRGVPGGSARMRAGRALASLSLIFLS